MFEQARHALALYDKVKTASQPQPQPHHVKQLPKAVPPPPRQKSVVQREVAKPSTAQAWQKAFEEQRLEIELRHYSKRTLKLYTYWAQRLQKFVGIQTPPQALDESHVKAFLGDLAITQHLAASTQNQAFNALLFFFQYGLKRPLQELKGIPRAKRRQKPERWLPFLRSCPTMTYKITVWWCKCCTAVAYVSKKS